MKLKIPFDEIKKVIEMASDKNHYYIDTKNQKMILISEHEDNFKKKIQELNKDQLIAIPPKDSKYDFIMSSFVYEIRDFNLAQEFDKIINQRDASKKFKEFLNQHPELRRKWFIYRDKELANETMNWLCMNNIEIEDKSFMSKIEIKELKPSEVKMPDGFEGFGPIECMRCKSREGFKTRYFELSHPNENMLIDKEIKRIMKEKFGLEDFGHFGGEEKEILTSSECTKCKSKDVFEDF